MTQQHEPGPEPGPSSSSLFSSSPSFNNDDAVGGGGGHSSNLADIAARVITESEFDPHPDLYDAVFTHNQLSSLFVEKDIVPQNDVVEDQEEEDEDESDFEFDVVRIDDDGESIITADEIFHNGQIRPIFPLFNNTDPISSSSSSSSSNLTRLFSPNSKTQQQAPQNPDSARVVVPDPIDSIRIPMRKLIIEEKETMMAKTAAVDVSCSSSEADELDNLPPGTYCMWKPKETMTDESMKKKSNSTGSSSKRWRLRELLRRSISDGGKEETLVFLSSPPPPPPIPTKEKEMKKKKKQAMVTTAVSVSAQEEDYLRRRAKRESDRRKSYLPYRRDLVGLFSNVNVSGAGAGGLGRFVQPF